MEHNTSKRKYPDAGAGLAIGAAIGMILGLMLFENLVLGFAIGAMVGLLMGAAKDEQRYHETDSDGENKS